MRQTAALAGLLHDIGKFWQRAEGSARQPLAPGFESFRKEDYGRNGAHATWSTAFIERYVPETFRKSISSAVFYHHNPQDDLARIVALADRLASSERLSAEKDEQPQLQVSIFSQLGGNRPDEIAYWPLRPLALEEATLFPQAQSTEKQVTQAAYQELWNGFVQDAARLEQVTDILTYIQSLLGLIHQYTWSVPSAYYASVPDISLYDHSRVTAALAACLVEQDDATIQRLLKARDGTVVAHLLEGDISGVQRFIYTITSKGAAKNLRGRSLYLQLLTEAAARFLLRRLELSITNLLYVGGGHFYLLVPSNMDEIITQARLELDELLLTHHDGDLYLALGTVPLQADEFEPEPFSKNWEALGRATGKDKRRRFAHLDAPQLAQTVFAPRGFGEQDEFQKRYAEREESSSEDQENIALQSAFRSSLETLGQRLKDARYLVFGEIAITPTAAGSWQNTLQQLGAAVGILDERGEHLVDFEAADLERATVWGLRDAVPPEITTDLAHKLRCPVAAALRYTVNITPTKGQRGVAEFTDMQQAAEGIKRLGVLRMDVDDLGQLFSQGLVQPDGTRIATLARVASLSSALGMFFEGWITSICERVNTEAQQIARIGESGEYVDVIQTIYSGGDDLFIVGAWDILPYLAEQISYDLSRFAAYNPAVHISAGITLHGGKYPLYQAASDAEMALDTAKNHPGKNAIHFLGQSVPWYSPDEAKLSWGDVVNWQRGLVNLIKMPGVGRSLLNVLLQLHADYRSSREASLNQGHGQTRNGQRQVVWGPWMWRSTYLLTRLAERTRGEAKTQVLQLRDELSKDNFRAIEIIGMAARWAEALTKKDKDHKEVE